MWYWAAAVSWACPSYRATEINESWKITGLFPSWLSSDSEKRKDNVIVFHKICLKFFVFHSFNSPHQIICSLLQRRFFNWQNFHLCSKETHYFTGSLVSWGVDAMWDISHFLQCIFTTKTKFFMSCRRSLCCRSNYFRGDLFCSWPYDTLHRMSRCGVRMLWGSSC